MAERRSLIEGVKPKPDTGRAAEEEFIYGGKPKTTNVPASPPLNAEAAVAISSPQTNRSPFTTRVRADIAQALKRASLERQLQGVTPNTVQDILEQALEPWLRANGYLP